MTVTLLAALSRNRVIGRGNQLPWHIAEDLKRFKALTLGHPVIMGRKTYESIGRPLPGRDNIVVSRSPDLSAPGCRVAHSVAAAVAAALTAASAAGEIFVIGGAQIYALALPLADRLQLTEVEAAIDGDAYFPEYDPMDWREVSRVPGSTPGPPGLRYDFVTYQRRA